MYRSLITKYIVVLFSFFCIFNFNYANAQCSASINTFPYNEGFENGPGNWAGQPDWALGTPQKSIISSAGGGINCWITGGLTGNSYANENSYLQSPCFDISSLQDPFISFKVNWESENGFDGGGFQYSTDGGATWNNLGSTQDAVDCPASHWYNSPNVRYLSSSQGWSGSSGQWVTAQHSLAPIKGATNVIFHFVFGAGTINNNFNGFAIDDIFIGEAPQFKTDFTFNCIANKEIGFADASTNCPNTFAWDFGDPNSGFANISNSENPNHIFSAAGTYTVNFTASSSTTVPATITKQISVLDVSVAGKDLSCNGANDGSVISTATGGNGAYNYSWNTTPVAQTQNISNLPAGTYTVTINTASGCPASATTTINEPTAITAIISVTNEICGNARGAITATVSGGEAPYRYKWSNGQTTQTINNLTAGTFSLRVTDKNNCSNDFTKIIVSDVRPQLHLFLGNDTTICPGQQLILKAGSFASYLWQDGSTRPTYTVTSTGNYSVKINDNNGCTASDSIHIVVDCNNIYFPSAFTPNGDGRNDSFGPWGNIPAVSNYTLTIYDRWGELVFRSNDPLQKWDGKYKGQDLNTGSFIWWSTFSLNNHPPETRQGTITIVR